MGGGSTFLSGPYSGKLFGGNIINNLGGSGTVLVDSTNNVGLLSRIQDGTGSLAVTKNGTGVAFFTDSSSGGPNSYSGVTNVNAGTLARR